MERRLSRLGPLAAAQGRDQGVPAASLAARAGSTAVVVRLERNLDTFKTGLNSFVNEARLLARFDHPSLVKVYRFWEENGTAYMVMPYYEGPTLKTALAELGHVPSEGELRTWLKPILDAVTVLHDGGTWHQNIGPDEILLTPMGPVLLGFASAAHAIEAINHTPAAALEARLRGDRAVRRRGRLDARAVDRSVRARCRDLRGDHRHRPGGGRRSPRQRSAAAARRRRGRPVQPRLPRRDRRRDGGAAQAAARRPRRVPRLDGRHRGARDGLARAAAGPDAGAFRRHPGERARDHGARPTGARAASAVARPGRGQAGGAADGERRRRRRARAAAAVGMRVGPAGARLGKRALLASSPAPAR